MLPYNLHSHLSTDIKSSLHFNENLCHKHAWADLALMSPGGCPGAEVLSVECGGPHSQSQLSSSSRKSPGCIS